MSNIITLFNKIIEEFVELKPYFCKFCHSGFLDTYYIALTNSIYIMFFGIDSWVKIIIYQNNNFDYNIMSKTGIYYLANEEDDELSKIIYELYSNNDFNINTIMSLIKENVKENI